MSDGQFTLPLIISILLSVMLAALVFSQASATPADLPVSKLEKLAAIKSHQKNRSAKALAKAFQATANKVRVIINTKPPAQPPAASPHKRQVRHKIAREHIDSIIHRVEANNLKVRSRFPLFNGFAAEVSMDGLEQLLRDEDVVAVYEDRKKYPLLSDGIALIKGQPARRTFGGTGVAVAVLDTGIDYSHPELGGGGFPNTKVIGGYDTGQDNNDPMDTEGHGTAVAGIVAGSSPLFEQGEYIGGVAPDAKLYALKITDGSGEAWDSDILEAIDWVIAHQYDDPNNPIEIINISFGGGQYANDCDADSYEQIYVEAVERVHQAGISIFAASGNEGHTGAISSPACLSGVIAVGEVYDADTGYSGPWETAEGSCADSQTYPDLVTCYSNSSISLELLAPGTEAYVTDISGNAGYSGDDYFSGFGGTSAASPYAAGVAALLQSVSMNYRHAFFTPAEVRSTLAATGDLVGDPRNGIVTPRVNIDTTLRSVIHQGDINIDSSVDLTDTILSLRILAGREAGQNYSVLANNNNNGAIGLEEALFTSRVLAGQVCPDTLLDTCETQAACEASTGTWLGESCEARPDCGLDNLELCPSKLQCLYAGGTWFNNIVCSYEPVASPEPNDSQQNANAIELNHPVSGNLFSGTDQDWYALTVDHPQAVTVAFRAGDSYSSGRWSISLLNESGELLTDLIVEHGDKSNVFLPAQGQYFFRIMQGPTKMNDSYTLLLARQDDTSSPAIEIEPNNDTVSATPISFERTVLGKVMYYTDRDWFRLTTEQPRIVTISISSQDPTDTSASYWDIYVYDDNDNLLMGSCFNASFDVALPAAGDYFIIVKNNTTAYEPYMLTAHANDDGPPHFVETEANDTALSADPIEFQKPVSGTLMYVGDQDWFMLHTESAQPIVVTFATNTSFTSWQVTVYDDAGTPLNTWQGSQGSFNVSLPAAGEYYIKVSDDGTEYMFTYNLMIEPAIDL